MSIANNGKKLSDLAANAAIVFRGYNITNLGRSAELLAHPAYGNIVRARLKEVGDAASDQLHRKIDLVSRIHRQQETDLDSFADAIAMIVAMEVAQIECLRQFFDFEIEKVKFTTGYSLGEITAAICSGIFTMTDALSVPLAHADDCAELGKQTSMGIVFSRGPALDLDAVHRICIEINQEARGVIGVSSYLSPNTVLVLGQHHTVDRFKQRMGERLPKHVHLRKNESHWPPLHTPIMWEKEIPNRSSRMMHRLPGGFGLPQPPILSLVTGKCSYNEYNCREILAQWIDHPQRVWDAVYETLSKGIETVLHVGPQPNLFPATFKRLSDNVQVQLSRTSPSGFGLRFVSGFVRRAWLTSMLPSRTALLRAPFVRHIVVEDWLLEQKTP